MNEIRIGCVEWKDYLNVCNNKANFSFEYYDLLLKSNMGLDLELMRYSFEIGLGTTLRKQVHFSMHQYMNYGSPFNATDPASGWDGMIGGLINNTVDITLPSMAVTYNRYNVVDFTFPGLYYDPESFLTNPVQSVNISPSIVNVFSLHTWIVGFITLIILSCVFMLINHISNRAIPPNSIRTKHSPINIHQLIRVMFGIMFEKRLVHRWSKIQALLLLTAWSGCGLMGLKLFSSVYVKNLTPKINHPHFDSAEELGSLLKIKEYRLIINANGIIGENMKEGSTYGPWAPLRDSLKFNKPYYIQNHSSGLNLVRDMKGTVYLTTKSLAAKLVASKLGSLLNVVDNINPQHYRYTFATRRGFVYMEEFKLGYLTLLEMGIVDKLYRKYLAVQEENKFEDIPFDYGMVPLTLPQIGEACKLLVYGITVAILTLLIESYIKLKYSFINNFPEAIAQEQEQQEE